MNQALEVLGEGVEGAYPAKAQVHRPSLLLMTDISHRIEEATISERDRDSMVEQTQISDLLRSRTLLANAQGILAMSLDPERGHLQDLM